MYLPFLYYPVETLTQGWAGTYVCILSQGAARLLGKGNLIDGQGANTDVGFFKPTATFQHGGSNYARVAAGWLQRDEDPRR